MTLDQSTLEVARRNEVVAGELTKDFHILPSVDHIRLLIAEDAKEISNDLKRQLVEQAELRRGSGRANFNIAPMYKNLVIKDLQAWTKLHGYIFYVARGVAHIEVAKKNKRSGLFKNKKTKWLIGLSCAWAVSIGMRAYTDFSPILDIALIVALVAISLYHIYL